MRDCESVKETLRVSDDDVRAAGVPQGGDIPTGTVLQSATGKELRPLFGRTLLPSVLDQAFKGEL